MFKQPTLIEFYDNNSQKMNTQIIDMKMGDCYTVFLSSRGQVFVMGDNIEGQLANDNFNVSYQTP